MAWKKLRLCNGVLPSSIKRRHDEYVKHALTGWRCAIIDEPVKVKQGPARECGTSPTQRYKRRQRAEEERDERHYINLLLISASPTAKKHR